MKIHFPRSEGHDDQTCDDDTRDDHTKDEIIKLAMKAFEWKELKCLSWYKLQTPHLGGNSPMELVQRKQTSKILRYLKQKEQERERGKDD